MLLALTVSLAQGADSSIEDAWSKEDLSPDQRTELVERSKKEPFAEIAPVILKALCEDQPLYDHGINPRGDTPWNDDRLSPRDRTYLMASAVWWHHMTPKDDPAKAKVILSLLRKASGRPEKRVLIAAITYHLSCPDAEAVLLDLAKDKKEDPDIRRAAASALLSRGDINVYMPLVVEVILAHDKGLPRCQAFNFTTNEGNRLFSLNEKNRRMLLAAGFQIITELSDEDLGTGYFVARRLGFILKIQDEFAPNPRAEQYQGEHGLTDAFFIDTVKNARAWYRKHKDEILGNQRSAPEDR
jgi:hypothetical protein